MRQAAEHQHHHAADPQQRRDSCRSAAAETSIATTIATMKAPVPTNTLDDVGIADEEHAPAARNRASAAERVAVFASRGRARSSSSLRSPRLRRRSPGRAPSGSNGRRSSIFSPTPIAWIGRPNRSAAATSTPPRAVPSSLVMTRPVTPAVSPNTSICDERVLAGRRVEHQHDVVRRVGVEPAEHAADLGELVHQPGLVLQPAGGVDDQHVGADRGAALDPFEHQAGGVAAFLAGDDRHVEPLGPDLELARSRRRGRCRRRPASPHNPAP